MNKLFLIRNAELFQGEKYLNTNKNYFEGWYFKNTNNKNGISFIPGININNHDKKAFIQVITNDLSFFVDYKIDDFEYSYSPFYIKIGDNFFSKDKIHIDIKDKNLTVFGDIKYSNNKNIYTNFLSPNIMGPFSYVSFMECNHAILSMKNNANGHIIINDNSLNITLSKGHYSLNIKSCYTSGLKLSAPVKGKMEKDIFESICESITLTLKKDDAIIFCDTSTNCGLEIVH